MGNCCSGSTVDQNGDIKTLDHMQLSKRMSAYQLNMLIKCQAVIRGYLTRKRIRTMQYNAGMGMGGFVYDDDGQLQQDYANEKVQVSTFLFGCCKQNQLIILFIQQEIRQDLGDFAYEQETNQYERNPNVEWRQEVELENHAKYEGQW